MKALRFAIPLVGLFVLSNVALAYPEPAPVSNSAAFRGWQDHADYVTTEPDIKSLTPISLKCAEPTLYPTHPQQTQKTYHVFKTGQYNHQKLNGDDDGCAMSSGTVGSKGTRFCLRPDAAEYAVISDVFMDRDGNSYRAFWEVQFLKKAESMGSLFSKGRTVYPNPKSQIPNDMQLGGTYPVSANEFLFLTEPFPGDIEKAQKQKLQALQGGFRFDPQTLLFQEP